MIQNGQEPTLLMTSLTYNLKPKNKNFFSFQTWRLTESFQGLISSQAQSPGDLCGW